MLWAIGIVLEVLALGVIVAFFNGAHVDEGELGK